MRVAEMGGWPVGWVPYLIKLSMHTHLETRTSGIPSRDQRTAYDRLNFRTPV
jgi:hypothetical protein